MRGGSENKLQQIVPSGLILCLAAIVCWISFTAEPAEAFLFPRLISSALVGLALLAFVNAVSGMAPPIPGFSQQMVANLAPGVVVMLVAVFWAAKTVGFYATVLVAFFVLASIYDPSGDRSPRSWLVRAAVTLCFVLVLYGLFSLLLRVQTPTGWLM